LLSKPAGLLAEAVLIPILIRDVVAGLVLQTITIAVTIAVTIRINGGSTEFCLGSRSRTRSRSRAGSGSSAAASAPSRARNTGSAARHTTACASPSGSRGGTSSMFSPSRTSGNSTAGCVVTIARP